MYDNLREKIQLVEEEFYMYSFFFLQHFTQDFLNLILNVFFI